MSDSNSSEHSYTPPYDDGYDRYAQADDYRSAHSSTYSHSTHSAQSSSSDRNNSDDEEYENCDNDETPLPSAFDLEQTYFTDMSDGNQRYAGSYYDAGGREQHGSGQGGQYFNPPPGPPPQQGHHGGGGGRFEPPSGPPPGRHEQGGQHGYQQQEQGYGRPQHGQQETYGRPQHQQQQESYGRPQQHEQQESYGRPQHQQQENYGRPQHQQQQGYQNQQQQGGRQQSQFTQQSHPGLAVTEANAQQAQSQGLSACTGRRKALVIGINYAGQSGELKGCINDTINLKEFISEHYGYESQNIVALTDDTRDSNLRPTRANILRWMQWLSEGAKRDDALFFHYSGHGTQVMTDDMSEADGLAEAICPVDYKEAGLLNDTEIFNTLVRPLPAGARLTAIFDCCHSGSAMNLPYMYSTQGKIKEPNFLETAGQGILSAGVGYMRGDTAGALSSLFTGVKTHVQATQANAALRKSNTSEADVISWSGCQDTQTSADTQAEGEATGAMSYALVRVLRANPQLSYKELLNELRTEMKKGGYTQKPQLSASHTIDTDMKFIA